MGEEWIERVEMASDDRHAFFMVRRLDAEVAVGKKRLLEEGTTQEYGKWDVLIVGDVILSCNGNIVTRMYDLNVQYSADSVGLV